MIKKILGNIVIVTFLSMSISTFADLFQKGYKVVNNTGLDLIYIKNKGNQDWIPVKKTVPYQCTGEQCLGELELLITPDLSQNLDNNALSYCPIVPIVPTASGLVTVIVGPKLLEGKHFSCTVQAP